MNDSELPETPEAAVDALHQWWAEAEGIWFADGGRKMAAVGARAVLVAATERIECLACGGTGDRVLYDESGYGNPPERESCPACSGSGVLFVLKTDPQ